MIDLDKEIELYKSKVAFYESQNTRGEYAVTVRELKFVVETLEALRSERSQGDLISREALKKEIVKLCEHINANNGITVPTLAFTRIINNAPTVDTACPHCDSGYAQGYSDGYLKGKEERPQGEWVSVSERLPEERKNPKTNDFEEVLCTTIWGDVRPYKFGKPIGTKEPHFWYGWGIMDKEIIAWQPLPEPYKKGGAE